MKNIGLSYMACGKFMYPQTLIDSHRQMELGYISTQHHKEIEAQCLRELVNRQVAVGLRIVSDGCILRSQWDFDFYFGLCGVEKRHVKSGHIYEDCDLSRPTPCITGRIEFSGEHPFFQQYLDLCSIMPDEVTASVLLPAPAHFLLWLLTQDSSWKSVYDDVFGLIDDIADAYRETLLKFYDFGCRHVVFEDRSWQSLCHRYDIKRIIQSGHDPHRLVEVLRGLNDRSLEELPADMDVMLYLKRLEKKMTTESMTNHCVSISEAVFGHTRIQTFILDMPDGFEGSVMALVKSLPIDKYLVLGVVNGRYPQLESAESIMAKIMEVQREIGDRLKAVTIIGGFKREASIIDSTAFIEEDQWKKIELLKNAVGSR